MAEDQPQAPPPAPPPQQTPQQTPAQPNPDRPDPRRREMSPFRKSNDMPPRTKKD